MSKMKVHIEANHSINIHNDIGNAAHYFRTRVNERIRNEDRQGVGLEIIAGLTMLAFEVEAKFNFFGAKLITRWNERENAKKKVNKVCAHLGVTPDYDRRPYRI